MRQFMRVVALLAVVVVMAAGPASANKAEFKQVKGEIKIDGSSTVYLITEAVATQFKKQNKDVKITVGISGTGGGFKKFSAGELDICDASRQISAAEVAACGNNKVEYIELQVAWDGLAVIINKKNAFAKQITVEQLNKIWAPNSTVKNWSDVDPKWPEKEIKLYGPGPDSGTFDYFTEAVNGKAKASRKDYQASEDDQNIVKGVENDEFAMGYLGVAYYEAHKDKLAVAAVKSKTGKEFVEPTPDNILSNTYEPLSRPLYLYVSKASLKRPEVQEFVKFYLRRNDLVSEVKYVPMSARQQLKVQKDYDKALADLK